MASPDKIASVIQKTLNEKRKVYSRKGEDNPYTSRSKDAKKKYLKTIQKTPYLYMLSDKSIQENRTDMDAIKDNMEKNENTTSLYTQTDMGYNETSYSGSLIDTGDEKKYYTKSYSTNNKNYLNKDYWTSGPVLLSNTELSEQVGKEIKFGMGMYESRGKNAENYGRPFRPNAGVKSLSSEYQSSGQQAFVRKVSVDWTCFDLEDLDFLQDRFMTLGRKVYVEWGWANEGMLKTPIFLTEKAVDGNYEINPNVTTDTQVFSVGEEGEELMVQTSAAKNLKKQVIENGKGNFDAIIGYVEGFEFSQREDGGFDCTTNLAVNGGNIFNIPKENKKAANQISNKKVAKEDFKKDISNLHKILHKYLRKNSHKTKTEYIYQNYATVDSITTSVADKFFRDKRTLTAEGLSHRTSYYQFDGNAVVKYNKVKEFDNYTVTGKMTDNRTTEEGNIAGANSLLKKMEWKTNDEERFLDVVPAECWVRWGWIEDVILNQHFALVNKDNDTIASHRSVELRDGIQQSILCANHKDFQTVDIGTFIFPGQFNLTKMTAKEFYEKQLPGWQNQSNQDPDDLKEKSLSDAHQNFLNSREKTRLSYTVGALDKSFYTRGDEDTTTIYDLQNKLLNHQMTAGNLNLEETGIIPYLELVQLSRAFKWIEDDQTWEGYTKDEDPTTMEMQSKMDYTHKERSFINRLEKDGKKYYDPSKGRIRNIFVNVAKLQDIFTTPSDTLKENFNLFFNSLYNETNGLMNWKVEILDDGGTAIVDDSKKDEGRLLDIINKKQVYEFPVHTNDSFVESQQLSSDIGSKMTQILMSKQYESQAIKDGKGNLIAQAVFDGFEGVEKITRKSDGKKETWTDTPTGTPYSLARDGDESFFGWGNSDGDEEKDLAKSISKDDITEVDDIELGGEPEDEVWSRTDDSKADAEQANKIFEGLHLDYTISGRLKKDKRKEMFRLIDLPDEEPGQFEDENGELYEVKKITDDKFGLLFITNTLEMTGIAGIKPGDVWTTSYLPKKFKDNAHFYTTNVTQTIDSSGWKTTIVGRVNMEFDKVRPDE